MSRWIKDIVSPIAALFVLDGLVLRDGSPERYSKKPLTKKQMKKRKASQAARTARRRNRP